MGLKRKSRRIVVFAPHFAEYATRLALALAEHASVLLILDKDNRQAEIGAALFAEVKAHLSFFEYRSRTRTQRRVYMAALLLRVLVFRPGILHLQEQGDLFTVLATKLLRRFCRVALTVHDPKPHSGSDASYALRMAPQLRQLRDMAALFHVHGAHCRDLLAGEVGTLRPIVATAHGVLMVPPASARRPAEPNRLLLFGRMEAYKGIEDGLDAMDLLRDRGIDVRLVLAGRGPEIDRLADRIAPDPRIIVLSRYLTQEEVIEQMQQAALVLAPYRDATQSGVVAAAFGNGRPVVATRVGGLVDAVRDGIDGLLVEARRPDALAAALSRLIGDEGMRGDLAAGARQAAEHSHSWATVARALIEGYDAILLDPAQNAAEAR